MSNNIYSIHYYNYTKNNIDVYFEYNNSVILNSVSILSNDEISNNREHKELLVISKIEIDPYASRLDLFRYNRGDILVIQGIISFFTGFPLTVYDCNSSANGITPIEYIKQDTHLIIDGIDYTNDLKILLNRLKQEPKLIISLLDKWRKAIFLKEESCDADLYYDEATLNFFHIFELLGESVNIELRNKLESNIEQMIFNHFQSCYYSDSKTKQYVNDYKKSVSSLLMGDHLNLAVKIKYYLEKYDLLDDNVAFFIDSMIKVRNAIAHGRITHQDKFLYPLPPFYSLSKYSYEKVDFLYLLSSEMISKYIGIKCWEEQWNEIKTFLMPPDYIISDFLDNLLTDFDNDMLNQRNKYNITWQTLFKYYVKHPKEEIRRHMERKLGNTFVNTTIDEYTAPEIFEISLIFADSEDCNIKNKAIENIKTTISQRWYGWSDYRDVLTYLDYYSVKVVWYKTFLINDNSDNRISS